jgi:hypothetical protein
MNGFMSIYKLPAGRKLVTGLCLALLLFSQVGAGVALPFGNLNSRRWPKWDYKS